MMGLWAKCEHETPRIQESEHFEPIDKKKENIRQTFVKISSVQLYTNTDMTRMDAVMCLLTVQR